MADIKVGDTVDVPGGMYGVVKFTGEVHGKKGTFAGVQLAQEFASKGRNNGDVDGVSYFRPTIAGSGIFLPIQRASRRASGPSTPPTPSLSQFNIGGRTPALPKFSQSIGPGARAASPTLKTKTSQPRRPSLPRPESPQRKTPGKLATPTARPSLGLSKSRIGTAGARPTPSPVPSKLGQSLLGPSRTPAKVSSGPEPMFDEEEESTPTPTPIGIAKTIDQTSKDDEIQRLKTKVEEKEHQIKERDQQLKEQTASLTEMETSFSELQALLPADGKSVRHTRDTSAPEDADVAQLRVLLREKNEKIAMLTAEFDSHRADFRSTIDTLEMASTETERVYEKRVEELLQENKELHDRGEDVETVARQLKQLEELVQELEEGLEDARRGEAEARGEVEFLRGEVERGRSELKREREKAAAALKGAGAAVEKSDRDGTKDLEQRDDEIRGLKAIIHSLSRDSVIPDAVSPQPNGRKSTQENGTVDPEHVANLERQIKELEGLVERKAYREEELERELDQLRGISAPNRGEKHKSAGTVGSHRLSDRTVVPGEWREQSIPAPPQLETMHEADSHSTVTDGSTLWCEICETAGHDILTCTNMFGNQPSTNAENGETNGNGFRAASPSPQRTGRDVVAEGLKDHGLSLGSLPPADMDRPLPLTPSKLSANTTPKISQGGLPMPNPLDQGMIPGKASGVVDENKWCALCERDGHESVDCPFEDAF